MGGVTENDVIAYYYDHVHHHRKNNPTWRGVLLDKFPQDILTYVDVIFKRKPQFIIETGTFRGGSALFFGDMLLLSGGKKVFSIDIRPIRDFPEHPLVQYVEGSSADPSVIEYIASQIDGPTMASLDSDHSTRHVLAEMELIAPLVTKSQYMVVEDAYTRSTRPYHPHYAIKDFLLRHREFRLYPIMQKKFVFGMTKGGWLRKR